ncbi:MAG: aminoglycoside phosphotransferase family protein [Dehalococcoidia bacterium]|nr:aminoglycoside phosphotransferase family protein [Dehalococcoidia bacterium]
MPVDPQEIVAALRLPPETTVELEPLGERFGAPVRATLHAEGSAAMVVLARRDPDGERAANHLAVMEALTNRGFPFAPKLLGVAGDAAIEEWEDGLTALNVQIDGDGLASAIDALAALHAQELREGLRWGATPGDLYPEEEIPLHRLGFAAHERGPAQEALAKARKRLLEGPFGFVHGDATAANILFTREGPRLVDFSAAGWGHQLFDVAVFLATCGAEAEVRRELAGRYARVRKLDPFATINGIELATLWWGLQEQLALPRKLVETLGDDGAIEALKLASSRVDRALRERVGNAAEAAAVRAALWPS